MEERKTRRHTKEAPLVFVAGPYFAREHETISRNIERAIAEGQQLFNDGYLALVVHNHTHHFEKKTQIGEPTYRAFDRMLLRKLVDAIKCLRNWRASQGARLEVHEMLGIGKPVFDSDEGLALWKAGKPHTGVTEITLSEADEKALAIPVPDIKIAFTLGPYIAVEEDYRQHHKCVLLAEVASVELWNAGCPAFSPQRALCDFNISMDQYRAFVDRVLASKISSCAVALPGWEQNEEAVRQAHLAASLNLPIMGDAASAVKFFQGKPGYYQVGVRS